MDCTTEFISYKDTGYFSSLMIDYLSDNPKLRPFYKYSPVHPNFEEIIAAKKAHPVNRELLVSELQNLYSGIQPEEKVSRNIRLLSEENTFTICTAHQPNLFTGYLYFIYKILHAIKLAVRLNKQYPQYHFVPVYYMGSEDNDLEELGTVYLQGKKYHWQTGQSGAVGRMRTTGLNALIDTLTKELGNNGYAGEIGDLLKQAYLEHEDIQTATLFLVNALFGRFGLVIVNADTSEFKRSILPVMREELFAQNSVSIVEDTAARLSEHYHAQATPRNINLFYLKEHLRERIVQQGNQWQVLNTDISFSKEQLEKELNEHPERFSPNVILRGILQESILPNIAFIGGGGELSYWLELKTLFEHFKVPFPLLLLRHSVLWADEKSVKRLDKTGLKVKDLFRDTEELVNEYVKTHTQEELVLKEEYGVIENLFQALEEKAGNIDVTLKPSVEAERVKALRSIGKLEHKFLRAEKNKFSWQTEIIRNIKNKLFPRNELQERIDNILPFYATYGSAFIDMVYENLDGVNEQFTIIKEKINPGENPG